MTSIFDLLDMLKLNLQLSTNLFDDYLEMLLKAATEEIERRGIVLEDTYSDSNLIVMYAAWLYRQRAQTTPEISYNTAAVRQTSMPRMLSLALNNRLFSQKMGDGS